MPSKVSIIIPVYNTDEYLGQCLDSILMQTYEDLEIICVDDESADDSLSTLQTYAMLDERLKIITQSHAGAAAARNRGLKESTGDYVIFLDSDDFFEADMLEKMVSKAEEDHSDIVIAGYYIFDNHTKLKTLDIKIQKEYLQKSPADPKDFGDKLFCISPAAMWTKLVRKDLILNNNILFDEQAHWADDVFFNDCALVNAKKISLMEDCFAYWRTNVPTQQTASRYKYFSDVLKTMQLVWDTVKNKQKEFLPQILSQTRKLLVQGLTNCPISRIKGNLLSISKNLSTEMYEGLFSSKTPADVSIVIPVYNAAEFLPECLDSCLNQTLKNIEIICVDDGSKDNSLEILNQYAQKDKRITVLHQENSRQAIARNKAMDVAHGAYIQFLDADDYLAPDASECLYLYCQLFQLEMCSLNVLHFENEKGKNSRILGRHLEWAKQMPSPIFSKKEIGAFLPQLEVGACITFYNHEFLKKNKIRWINQKIAYEDTPFFIESVLKVKRMGILNLPLYYRRQHSASTIHQINNNLDDFIKIAQYTLNGMEKWGTKIELHLFANRFLNTMYGVYASFENTEKFKMAPFLYDFCACLQKRYHFLLPTHIFKWCLIYLKEQHKIKEKLKFYWFRFVAYSVRKEYHLNLFSFYRQPFKLCILGIPVLCLKSKTSSKNSDTHKTQQNQYISFLRFPLLKISTTTDSKTSESDKIEIDYNTCLFPH